MHCSKRPKRVSAFTLVELLVVIAIIGILIAMLLPAVQAAREAARRMQCSNHFKQVGVALHNYHTAHRTFPPGVMLWSSSAPPDSSCGTFPSTTYAGGSWSVGILPYLEQPAVYSMVKFDQPGWNYQIRESTFLASGKKIETYLCPSDPQGGELVVANSSDQQPGTTHPDEDVRQCNMAGVSDSTSYLCSVGWPRTFDVVDGMMGNITGAKLSQVRDGTSRTLFVGEVTGGGPGSHQGHFWMSWNVLNTVDGINGPNTVIGGMWPSYVWGHFYTGFSSFHPGGCNFLLVDGSVHFFSQNIDQNVLIALTTRDGGEATRNGDD